MLPIHSILKTEKGLNAEAQQETYRAWQQEMLTVEEKKEEENKDERD